MAHRLGARHEVIPGAIHSPAIENPPRTVEVLLDFWASVPAAGRSAEDAEALR
jgi:pimeloyl-ACP methyl ester carboxylesterase